MESIQEAFSRVLKERVINLEEELNQNQEYADAQDCYRVLFHRLQKCKMEEIVDAVNELDGVVSMLLVITEELVYKRGIIDGAQLKEEGINVESLGRIVKFYPHMEESCNEDKPGSFIQRQRGIQCHL